MVEGRCDSSSTGTLNRPRIANVGSRPCRLPYNPEYEQHQGLHLLLRTTSTSLAPSSQWKVHRLLFAALLSSFCSRLIVLLLKLSA
jgi:hypothetical protein